MSLLSFFSKPAVKAAFSTLLNELQNAVNGVVAPAVAVATDFASKSPREKLVSMLNHSEYKFRSLDTLEAKSGLSGEEIVRVLVEIGARRAERRGSIIYDSWGLIKRVGPGRRVASVTSSPSEPTSFASKTPKQKLVSMLNHSEFKFRSTDTLSDKSGLYGAELEAALIEAGARRAVRRGRELDSWGLISRVGAARGVVRAVTSSDPVSPERQAKINNLIAVLNEPGYQYRSESTLRKKLSVNDAELQELLALVDARPARRDGEDTDLWGLVSRVGGGPNANDDDEDGDDWSDAEDDWDNNDENG